MLVLTQRQRTWWQINKSNTSTNAHLLNTLPPLEEGIVYHKYGDVFWTSTTVGQLLFNEVLKNVTFGGALKGARRIPFYVYAGRI